MSKNSKKRKSGKEKYCDVPVERALLNREKYTQNWVEHQGKRVIEEFLECEQFDMGDDDRRAVFVTNKTADREYPSSPTGESPMLLEIRESVRVAYEHAIPRMTVGERRRGKWFTVMAGLNVSHAIMFPFVMMRFGGFYFLIPFLVVTCLVAFPANLVQYCVGQFSSFPPAVLFSRMAPVCSGIGIVVFFVQYFVAAGIRFDHRFIAMAIEFWYSLFSERKESEEGIPPEKIFDPSYQHSHYISAAVVFTLTLFFTSLNGIKTFFQLIQHVVFVFVAFGCALNIVYIVGHWEDKAVILIDVIGWDAAKLLSLETWVVATVNSLVLFSTGDATFLSVGAVSQFSNNPVRDVIRATVGGLLMLFTLSFLFGMVTVVGVDIFFSRISDIDPTVEDYRSVIYGDAQVYQFVYTFFFQSLAFKLWAVLFSVLFAFWQISSLMLQAHGAVGSFYRIFPSAARLPQFTIRYIFLFFHCAALTFLHFFLYRFRHLPFLLSTHSVLLQIFSFNVIGFKRIFVISLTTCSKNRAFIYRIRKFLLVYMQIFLPIFILCTVVFEIQQNGIYLLKMALTPALLIAVSVVYRFRLRSKTFAAFKPTSSFRPTFNRDHDEFKKYEKAMSGKGKMEPFGFWKSARKMASEIRRKQQ